MIQKQTCECMACGHKWPAGTIDNHSCVKILTLKIKELEEELKMSQNLIERYEEFIDNEKEEYKQTSRKIKFRICYTAQDGSKKIIYSEDDDGYLIALDGTVLEDYLSPKQMFEPIFDVIIQQYTGFKDKNEKEIYEGDIFKNRNNSDLAIVSFYQGSFRFIYANEYPEKDGIQQDNFLENFQNLSEKDNIEALEVVGNIFENSSLLNE